MEILISKTEKFVIELFNNKLDNKFVFHNLAHTQQVVDNVHQLVEVSAIENRDKDILLLSAWLHDTGYTVSSKNHEMESVKIAKAFLLENNCNASYIDTISALIMATKINHHQRIEGRYWPIKQSNLQCKYPKCCHAITASSTCDNR